MSGGHEKRAFESIGLSFILVAYLLLLVPFTIYVGNINEFRVSFGAILSVGLPAILLLAGVLGLVGMLVPARYFTAYKTLLATVSILIWLQGNLLVWDYGPLDGRAIDWTKDAWRGWIDLGIWLGALTVALVARRRIVQHVVSVAVVLFVLQLLLFSFNWLSNFDELSKKSDVPILPGPLEELYRFSSKKNVVHIIADGFQSDVFEDIIHDGGEGERLASALEGFTFFREHLGAFPYTQMSVSAILSGKIYKNNVPISDFLDTAIGGETILDAAHDAGYEVDLVVPASLAYMYKRSPSANVYPVPGRQHVTRIQYAIYDAARLLDLVLFRLSPHFIKKYIYNDQIWLIQPLFIDKGYMGLRFFAHTAFLKTLREKMVADRQRPVYKLLHLMLSHNPMVTDPQCGYAGHVLRTVRATVTVQARCGLRAVVSLFERMKQLGIYDDALIILMADHGAWVTPRRLTSKPSSDGDSFEIVNPAFAALALPLLAIKRPNESGALKTTNAPSSIIDTPATIAGALGLDGKFGGRSVFELGEDETRERRFFIYWYRGNDWTNDYLDPIHEFVLNGDGVDSASWRSANIYAREGIVVKASGKSPLWTKVKPEQ